MATFRRNPVCGGTCFFTVCTYRRDPLLTNPGILASLRSALRTVRASQPFSVDAIVLLPDHLHCIWTLPPGDAEFAARWSRIKRLTSQAAGVAAAAHVSGVNRREAGLWQRRFWEHQIRNEDDMARHIDYIHWNPVKHGHVAAVKQWPMSSFHRYVREGRLPADWGGLGAAEGYFGE